MTSMDLRMRILANATPAEQSLQDIQKTAKGTADGIKSAFRGIGKYIIGAVGISGIGIAMKSAIDDAETYNSALNLQSTIIKNQVTSKKTLAQLDITRNKYTGEYSSSYLSNMQQVLSLQTSVNESQIASAQTMLLSNKDLVGMFTTGAKYTSGMYKGMNKEFMTANLTVLNLSARMAAMMGAGGSGNPAMAAKALNKALADPSKGLSAFSRFGIELPMAEQNAIKAVEKTAKGATVSAKQLDVARHMLIDDLNKQSKGAAIAAATPMQTLTNMWKILMTDFGQVFMPMLYGLKEALGGIVKPLSKVLSLLGDSLGSIMVNLGHEIGTMLQMLEPFFAFLTGDVLPMLVKVFDPLVKIVVAVFQPIAKVFAQMVSQSGPIGKVFTLIGNTMDASLTQVAVILGNTMQQMAASGALTAIFTSIAQAMMILAPVLPELVTAFAKLAVALTPAAVKIIQGMADGMVIFANMINKLTPVLTTIVTWITTLATKFKGIIDPLGIIVGLWFTKSLFLTPLMAAIGGVETLAGKLVGLKGKLSDIRNTVSGGMGHNARGDALKAKSDASYAKRMEEVNRLKSTGSLKDAEKAKRLEGTLSKAERDSKEFERAGSASLLHGGGLRGMIKGVLGMGMSGGFTNTPAADNQLSATNNLVTALNNLNNTISSSGFGQNGSLTKDAKEGEGILGKVKKVAGLGGEEGAAAEGAEGLAATGVEAEGVAGAGAAAEGAGVLGIGALGVGTLGIGLAVAGATAAYIKWHKAINHAVEDGAKHLWNGAKDVAKAGVDIAKHVGHGVEDVAKGVAHVGGSILHSVGGFLGGLFGGGSHSTPSHSGGHMKGMSDQANRLLEQITFQTGGLLNVNIAGHTLSAGQAQRILSPFGNPAASMFGGKQSVTNNASAKGLQPMDLANISRLVNAQPREVNITVAEGAFQVNVQGSLDSATMPDVKGHVYDQFNQLRYVLKTKGR